MGIRLCSAATTVTVTASPTRPTTTPSPETSTIDTDAGKVTVECPSADGLNFTAPGTTRVYRRQCNANYNGGDGDLGLQKNTILSMVDCMNACALHSDCVGVVFNYAPQCWLKQSIGVRSDGPGQEAAVLWQ